jgi:predicted O-linked N-acetylglucosamine transferase (SPINDLY family)
LKIGYLSADFYDHATSHLIAGVIEAHDRDRFELVGYDLSPPREDDYRARMRAAFGNFVSMHEMPNEVAADRIVTDEIDVVIDLNGWTAGNRASVLAPRPAPVQVQWLGYAGTVGAPWIDYIIADRTLIPPEDEIFYSEKVIRLPDTYQPNDRDRIMGERGERTDHALPMDAFVFCSFNQSFKITRDVFDVWMRLLHDVPRSILWLLESNPEAMQALRAQASARGILTERLVFAPKVSSAAHRARIAHADLALDCFPYGSHTTCSDVLHAGVPLVALKGDTFASRVSASLLSAAGLTDLVTSTLADYYDMARALASDRDRLNLLRDRARGARASALFDTKRFTLKLEHALAECCRRHAEGATPASFDVP